MNIWYTVAAAVFTLMCYAFVLQQLVDRIGMFAGITVGMIIPLLLIGYFVS